MKKSLILLALFLVSCSSGMEVTGEEVLSNSETSVEENSVQVEEASESYIQINSPDDQAVHAAGPILMFEGEVSPDALAIWVENDFTRTDIENDTSTPETISTELAGFQPGDTNFTYAAATNIDYNNLGLGENNFTFTAEFADGTQQSVTRSLCVQFEVFYPPSCWR